MAAGDKLTNNSSPGRSVRVHLRLCGCEFSILFHGSGNSDPSFRTVFPRLKYANRNLAEGSLRISGRYARPAARRLASEPQISTLGRVVGDSAGIRTDF